MSNREEALLRIFEATGVSGRLTDDQRRELLTHLEDAVASKVAAGAAEIDAIGRAFAELGPLPRIADALSPAGTRLATWSRGAALKGVALLAVFSFIQVFLTPKFAWLFEDTGVEVPWLMGVFVGRAEGMDFLVALLGTMLIATGILQRVARRKGWAGATQARLKVSALALYGIVATLCAGLVLGCGLPGVTLFGSLLP